LPCAPVARTLAVLDPRGAPAMSITINRRYRDAVYDGLMTDLTAIGDIFSHLQQRTQQRPASAPPLRGRAAAAR
jgi:hypothetical protein